MQLGLENKVAVVTGGSSGIGFATASLLLEEGARVAICGRDGGKLEAAGAELGKINGADQVLTYRCDVLDSREVAAFAASVNTAFGGCHALINNAGGGRVSTFASTTDDEWLDESRLKLFSVIYPTRAFLPLLQQQQGAAIAVVNSLLALQPEAHMVATSAARAGLLNLVRSMASEFAPLGIRVNSILLGTIVSGQWWRRYEKQAQPGESYEQYLTRLARQKSIPLGRFGRPEEAANALVYLVSAASSFTTGSSIDVSGGVARHI